MNLQMQYHYLVTLRNGTTLELTLNGCPDIRAVVRKMNRNRPRPYQIVDFRRVTPTN